MRILIAILLLNLSACASTYVPHDPYPSQFHTVLDEDYSTGKLVYVYNPRINVDCASYWESETVGKGAEYKTFIETVYNHCRRQSTIITPYNNIDILDIMFPADITVRVQD